MTGIFLVQVKISLSRPERDWKNKCLRDRVGCMMGFYLMVGTKPNRDQSKTIFYEVRTALIVTVYERERVTRLYHVRHSCHVIEITEAHPACYTLLMVYHFMV